MRSLLVLTLVATSAAAEPHRADRPHAISGGIAGIGAGRGQALPFVTAQGVFDLEAWLSVVIDAAFFTSGDRVFGPRGLLRAGVRGYLRDGSWSPFAAMSGVGYHEFDVDYPYSDASQSDSTSLGAGMTLGNEFATSGGFTWVLEASAFQLFGLSDRAADGLSWQLDTRFGYRF